MRYEKKGEKIEIKATNGLQSKSARVPCTTSRVKRTWWGCIVTWERTSEGSGSAVRPVILFFYFIFFNFFCSLEKLEKKWQAAEKKVRPKSKPMWPWALRGPIPSDFDFLNTTPPPPTVSKISLPYSQFYSFMDINYCLHYWMCWTSLSLTQL